MTPKELKVVRSFFAKNDGKIDTIVAQTFRNIFAAAPDAASLFSRAIESHCQGYARMFRQIIDQTRASHLWPVTTFTGHAAIPGLGDLRCRHQANGVTLAHFDVMKVALLEAMQSCAPDDFNSEVSRAFGELFDTLTRSLTSDHGATEVCTKELDALLARQDGTPTGAGMEAFMAPLAAE